MEGVVADVCADRTGELRKLGFEGRRLGAEQMTTDTAARVTRMVVQEKSMFTVPYFRLLGCDACFWRQRQVP